MTTSILHQYFLVIRPLLLAFQCRKQRFRWKLQHKSNPNKQIGISDIRKGMHMYDPPF